MSNDLIKTGRIVTVFGGSGFVGRHVVRALAKDDWRIRVATRRPDLAFHLQPLGKVGQVHAVQANVRFPASIAAAIKGAEAVVNLVGIQSEAGRQTFEATNVFGARAIARAARDAGIANFVQMSGIGVDAKSDSAYVRSRAQGEAAVREALPGAVILQPSIIFGPEDRFFNRFATIARLSPVLPLFGGGDTRLQPVFVGDVAQAVARALAGGARPGAIYELGGPGVHSMREIMQFICATIDRKRPLAPVPAPLGRVFALATEIASKISLGLFPAALLITRDQLKLLAQDNVVSAAAIAEKRTLEGLGIAPDTFESIVPTYLGRFRPMGQFQQKKSA